MAINEQITKARESAMMASNVAGNLAAEGATVADSIKEKALKAYEDNQDIIGKLDTATAGYYGAPAEARNKFQDIWNPFQREDLVSQYTQNQSIPMLSYASVLGQRMGRIDDIIGAGTRAFDAETARRQALAASAQQYWENLFKEAQFEESQRQFNTTATQPDLFDWLQNLQPEDTSRYGQTPIPADMLYRDISDEPLDDFWSGVGNLVTQSVGQAVQQAPSRAVDLYSNYSPARITSEIDERVVKPVSNWLLNLFK